MTQNNYKYSKIRIIEFFHTKLLYINLTQVGEKACGRTQSYTLGNLTYLALGRMINSLMTLKLELETLTSIPSSMLARFLGV